LLSSPAFADDVDILPNGYVSSVIRQLQADGSRSYSVTASLGETGTARTKSRAQVIAETREADRLGLLSHGESYAVEATPEQTRQIEQAGLRALAIESASK
jgi:hypothetical protein